MTNITTEVFTMYSNRIMDLNIDPFILKLTPEQTSITIELNIESFPILEGTIFSSSHKSVLEATIRKYVEDCYQQALKTFFRSDEVECLFNNTGTSFSVWIPF